MNNYKTNTNTFSKNNNTQISQYDTSTSKQETQNRRTFKQIQENLDSLENSMKDNLEKQFQEFEQKIKKYSKQVQYQLCDQLINICDSILQNPYHDKYRIINSMFFRSKVFQFPVCSALLEKIGFKPISKGQEGNLTCLICPYDYQLSILDRLKEKIIDSMNKTETMGLLQDFEGKINFDCIRQYIDIFDADLSSKHSKDFRQKLKISLDEVYDILEYIDAKTLKEYIALYGEVSETFQPVVYKCFKSQKLACDFLNILRKLWLECNVLRRCSVHLSQGFSDQISRTQLNLGNDNDSNFARNLLEIDIMQAQGLIKRANDKIITLEDAVRLTILRERLLLEEDIPSVEDLDKILSQGLYNKEKVTKFWKNAQDCIIERCSGKPLRRRVKLTLDQIQVWCKSERPQLEPGDLAIYTKERISKFASELIQQIIEAQEADFSQEEIENLKAQSEKGLSQLIWNPQIWLHQKEISDDLMLYTCCSFLCQQKGRQIDLDLKHEFTDFLVKHVPEINQPGSVPSDTNPKLKPMLMKEYYNLLDKLGLRKDLKAISQYGNSTIGVTRLLKSPNLEQFEEWYYLYEQKSPIILQACVINQHYEKLREFIESGLSVNVRDHTGQTPLHWAAALGQLDIIEYLVQKGGDVNCFDLDQRTPTDVAYNYQNYTQEKSACAILLEKGAIVAEDTFQKLLQYSVLNDVVAYIRIAHQRGVYLFNNDRQDRISLHQMIKYKAKKILGYLASAIEPSVLRAACYATDLEGKTGLDYAEETLDEAYIQNVNDIICGYYYKGPLNLIEERNLKLQENENAFQNSQSKKVITNISSSGFQQISNQIEETAEKKLRLHNLKYNPPKSKYEGDPDQYELPSVASSQLNLIKDQNQKNSPEKLIQKNESKQPSAREGSIKSTSDVVMVNNDKNIKSEKAFTEEPQFRQTLINAAKGSYLSNRSSSESQNQQSESNEKSSEKSSNNSQLQFRGPSRGKNAKQISLNRAQNVSQIPDNQVYANNLKNYMADLMKQQQNQQQINQQNPTELNQQDKQENANNQKNTNSKACVIM